MRVFCIDPSFHDVAGHHFAVNQLISTECRRRGISCAVLGNSQVDLEIPGMDIRKVFSSTLYGFLPDHEMSPMHKAVQLNLSFEEEMGRPCPPRRCVREMSSSPTPSPTPTWWACFAGTGIWTCPT